MTTQDKDGEEGGQCSDYRDKPCSLFTRIGEKDATQYRYHAEGEGHPLTSVSPTVVSANYHRLHLSTVVALIRKLVNDD
jgi:hypothetical protein